MSLSCQKQLDWDGSFIPETGTLHLNWQAVFEGSPLEFGSNYVNGSGETFQIQKFMYYVHSVELQKTSGEWVRISGNEHTLLNFIRPETLQQQWPLEVGAYKQLRFVVGVDSVRNYSGDQVGPLDPLNGMFWAWTSGYVFAKLEGWSSFSTAPNQEFTYHVGGYKPPYVAIRRIHLPLTGSRRLNMVKYGVKHIQLQADVVHWFDGAHTISIAQQYAVHSPSALATQLADNYAAMFSVLSVE